MMLIDLMGIEFDLIHGDVKELTYEQQNVVTFCRNWLNNTAGFEVKTSGSTGVPKNIFISRQQALASVSMTQSALKLQPGWHSLVCLDTETIAGKMMLIRSLEIGMHLHIVSPVSNPFKQLNTDTNIDFVAMVPLQVSQILADGDLQKLNGAKVILVGGAAVSSDLEKQIEAITCRVYQTYGMTETVSHIAIRLINTIKKQPVYKKLKNIGIKKDSRHCLCIKGTVTNNEWLVTNDVVQLLPYGYFQLMGRIDNVVNSGGVKIQLEEIEQIIANYFFRQKNANRFFLSSLPHATLGSQVILIIEGDEWSKEKQQQLLQSLQQLCPKYQSPKLIFFVTNFLETKSQKIDRVATRRLINMNDEF